MSFYQLTINENLQQGDWDGEEATGGGETKAGGGKGEVFGDYHWDYLEWYLEWYLWWYLEISCILLEIEIKITVQISQHEYFAFTKNTKK